MLACLSHCALHILRHCAPSNPVAHFSSLLCSNSLQRTRAYLHDPLVGDKCIGIPALSRRRRSGRGVLCFGSRIEQQKMYRTGHTCKLLNGKHLRALRGTTQKGTHTFSRVADPGSGLGPYPVLKCVKRNCKVRHSLAEGAGKRWRRGGGFGSLDFPMTHMQFKIVSQYVATVWVFVNAFCVTFN